MSYKTSTKFETSWLKLTNSTVLRPLHISHLSLAQEIVEKARRAKVPDFGGAWGEKEIQNGIENSDTMGIFAGQQLVAFVFFRHNVDHLDITLLMADPAEQRKGYGRKLILWLRNKYPGLKLFVEVSVANAPALAFYEKLTFEKAGYRQNYYGNGLDAHVLVSI